MKNIVILVIGMDPVTFGYSKIFAWIGCIFIIAFSLIILFMAYSSHDYHAWLAFLPIFAVLIVLSFYFVTNCFLPMLRNEAALSIDDEKVVCYISDRTIYWKDVVEINWGGAIIYGTISFAMIDESDVVINIKWIKGSRTSIYNTLQDYFAYVLKTE